MGIAYSVINTNELLLNSATQKYCLIFNHSWSSGIKIPLSINQKHETQNSLCLNETERK